MWFTFIMSLAILCVGIIVQLVECYTEGDDGSTKCPAFEPVAMLGGVIWATGNMLTPAIIKCLGLGLGMALWGSVNMLVGWATGKFGLFGLSPDKVSSPGLNYAGVALSTCAICVFLFIKPSVEGPKGAKTLDGEDDEETAADGLLDGEEEDGKLASGSEGGSFIDRMAPGPKRMLGIFGSCVAGILYGANFDPPSYVAQRANNPAYPGASSNLVDYVLPHFLGIFLANTFFFLAYAALKRGEPMLLPRVTLPGFLSGAMWALAQSAWFIANGRLSLSIAFPLIATGPGLIANLWGALVFKEVQGKRNLVLLGVAFVLVISSAVLISLSK